MMQPPPSSTLLPYTTLFRSDVCETRSSPRRRQAVPNARRRPRRQGPQGESRSEEHTSELQSLAYLVCRLLLEKKKTIDDLHRSTTRTAKRHPISSSCSNSSP